VNAEGPQKTRAATLFDGRILSATQADPTAEWYVRVNDYPESERSGRWLLPLVYSAVGLEPHDARAAEIVADLTGFDTPAGRRFPCPCCDLLTLEKPPAGTHQLCPVCFWEDDAQQYEQLDQLAGANRVTLREARDNFRSFGASDRSSVDSVRPPEPYEVPPAGPES
jgi:hypothetical protein